MAENVVKARNNFRHGRRSKVMKDFLKRHGLEDLQFPETGSLAKDMALSVAALKEKQDAMQVALQLLGSGDKRALTLYNQLLDVQGKLARLEQEYEGNAKALLMNPMYLKWQQLVFDILKHFNKMQFDLAKVKVENKIKNIQQLDDDVLYVVEEESVQPSSWVW